VVACQAELAIDGTFWINRCEISGVDDLGIDELMQNVLCEIERCGYYPDSLLYVNYDYVDRPAGLLDELIQDAQYKGYDCVFPGFVDYGHYWFRAENEQYRQTDPSMKNRDSRNPVYRALYGLGCLSSSVVVRQGKLVGGKIGILPIEHMRHTLRGRDLQDSTVIESFF